MSVTRSGSWLDRRLPVLGARLAEIDPFARRERPQRPLLCQVGVLPELNVEPDHPQGLFEPVQLGNRIDLSRCSRQWVVRVDPWIHTHCLSPSFGSHRYSTMSRSIQVQNENTERGVPRLGWPGPAGCRRTVGQLAARVGYTTDGGRHLYGGGPFASVWRQQARATTRNGYPQGATWASLVTPSRPLVGSGRGGPGSDAPGPVALSPPTSGS